MPGPDEMKPSTAGVKLTYDDFLLFPDDGQRHELIDGEHHVTPSPNTRHQDVLLRLTLSVGGWLETHSIGRIFFAPYDVVLSRFDVVEPDLLYLSHQRAAQMLTPQHAVGAPELVVEGASPGTRKRDGPNDSAGLRALARSRRRPHHDHSARARAPALACPTGLTNPAPVKRPGAWRTRTPTPDAPAGLA
jgi:hypothetical protein